MQIRKRCGLFFKMPRHHKSLQKMGWLQCLRQIEAGQEGVTSSGDKDMREEIKI